MANSVYACNSFYFSSIHLVKESITSLTDTQPRDKLLQGAWIQCCWWNQQKTLLWTCLKHGICMKCFLAGLLIVWGKYSFSRESVLRKWSNIFLTCTHLTCPLDCPAPPLFFSHLHFSFMGLFLYTVGPQTRLLVPSCCVILYIYIQPRIAELTNAVTHLTAGRCQQSML